MGSKLPLISSMKGSADTLGGIYHFLGDRTPRGMDVVPPKRRKENPFRRDGMALVSKVHVEHDLLSSVGRSVELIGGLKSMRW